jgi:hypothetical protein
LQIKLNPKTVCAILACPAFQQQKKDKKMSNKEKTVIDQERPSLPSDYRRENYCKFPKLRSELIADLEIGRSAKESAKRLCISEATYYKYKGLVCCQLGKVFIVPEEKAFLERHSPSIKPATISTPTAAPRRKGHECI